MKHEPALKAAMDYMKGLQLRGELHALSQGEIVKKFNRSERTIRAICKGKKTRVPDSERQLILDCLEERERLKEICKGLTVHALARKYRISRNTLKKYVDDWSES